MIKVRAWFDAIPWSVLVVACLTLGLAPFSPPHLVEKAQWLLSGRRLKPIDWFDVAFHGFPWLLLLAKGISSATKA